MSYIEIEGIKSYYEKQGDKGYPVILLHGWGQNTVMMKPIQEFLKANFVVYNFDFPSFGKSDAQSEPWGCLEYTAWLRKVLIKLNVENPIIIAHSFGCRIAFHYAFEYPVRRMVLTGAAGLKKELSLFKKVKVKSYKLAKKILIGLNQKELLVKLQNKAGSKDYQAASGVLRASFVKIVNDDVKDLLPKIKTETLLVFGENDKATPLKQGEIIEKLMPNATLIVFKNDDHYAYFNQAARFNMVLDAYLKQDYLKQED